MWSCVEMRNEAFWEHRKKANLFGEIMDCDYFFLLTFNPSTKGLNLGMGHFLKAMLTLKSKFFGIFVVVVIGKIDF